MATDTGRFPLVGEPVSIDLVNTVYAVRGRPTDGLTSPNLLRDWLRQRGFRVDDVMQRDLDAALLLRDAIRHIAEAVVQGGVPDADAVADLNRCASAFPRWYELVEEPTPHALERSGGRPVEAALSAVATDAVVLFGGPMCHRLRACRGPGCILFFIGDGRREWCTAGCGNRARAARHYARSKQT